MGTAAEEGLSARPALARLSPGSALACLCSMHDNRWEKEEEDRTLPASAGEDKAKAASVLQVGRAACGHCFLLLPKSIWETQVGLFPSQLWSTIKSKLVLRSPL